MAGYNQKQKLLYIARFLEECSSEEHPVSTAEIIDHLNSNGIEAERKTVYSDIETLIDFGYDIQKYHGKTHGYFIGSRKFELPELKVLVDAVQASRFLTEKKTNGLIKKLEGLTDKHSAHQLRRQLVSKRVKSINDNVYYNVDRIHAAINSGKKITFTYYEWTLSGTAHAERKLRKGGEKYTISPFALVWEDENYYVTAYYEKYDNITHFRVDRMDRIEIIDEDCDGKEKFKEYDINENSKKIFGMFAGKETEIKLQFKKDNAFLAVIVDRFGKNIYISQPDDEHFVIRVKVSESPVFWGWLFSFGNNVKILAPESMKEKYNEMLKQTLEENK